MATPKRPQLQRGVYSFGKNLAVKWTFIHNGSAKWSTGGFIHRGISLRRYKIKDDRVFSEKDRDHVKFIVPVELIKNLEE